jgi:hypothetical protein
MACGRGGLAAGESGVSVQIVYHPASTDVTLAFARGPVNLEAYWDVRCHDNLATSGAARERVMENPDILIGFEMPHMLVADDLVGWAAFEAWALAGGQFKFYPCSTLTSDYYNCVLEDTKWAPKRNAPRKYGFTVVIRILQDGQAPAGPDVVLQRYHGIGAS